MRMAWMRTAVLTSMGLLGTFGCAANRHSHLERRLQSAIGAALSRDHVSGGPRIARATRLLSANLSDSVVESAQGREVVKMLTLNLSKEVAAEGQGVFEDTVALISVAAGEALGDGQFEQLYILIEGRPYAPITGEAPERR